MLHCWPASHKIFKLSVSYVLHELEINDTFFSGQFISHPTQAINALGQGRLMNAYDEPAPRWNTRDPRFSAGLGPTTMDEDTPVASISGQSKYLDFQHIQEPNRAHSPVAALKDFVRMFLLVCLHMGRLSDSL